MPENTTLSFEPQLNCPWQWRRVFFAIVYDVSRLWRLFASVFSWIMQTLSNIKQWLMQRRNRMASKLKKKQCMLCWRSFIRSDGNLLKFINIQEIKLHHTEYKVVHWISNIRSREKCIQIPETCALNSQTDTLSLWIRKYRIAMVVSTWTKHRQHSLWDRKNERCYHTHNPKCQIPKGN